MAKTKISEFSSTPSDNTDIDSINIAEGCAPSGINNAIRELMAQLKDQQTGAAGDSFVVGGGFTSAGAAIFSSTVTHNGAVTNASTVTNSSTVTNNGAVTSNAAVTNNAATIISVTDNTNAALRVTQLGTGNALLVEDSTNPDATPFVIDATGKVNVGSSTWYLAPALSAVAPAKIQFNGAVGPDASLALNSWQTGTNVDANLLFNRGDTSIIGDFSGAVDSGDALGSIKWSGSDGTEFIQGASIQAYVDGTPGTGDMPGRLVFSTTADGAATATERVRIGSAGQIGIAGANYGTSGQVLTSGGSAAAPAWSDIPVVGSITLLGTLTTTSGTTQTLSGLTLTDYKTLQVFINNCSTNAGSAASLRLESIIVIDTAVTNVGSVWGCVSIDLSNGAFGAALGTGIATTANTSVGSNSRSGKMPVTNANTSLIFSWNIGSFDAGSILVYGVK